MAINNGILIQFGKNHTDTYGSKYKGTCVLPIAFETTTYSITASGCDDVGGGYCIDVSSRSITQYVYYEHSFRNRLYIAIGH